MKILPPGLTFEQCITRGYTGRIECRGYLDWIKTLPCDRCGAAPPSDPSHINTLKGAGTKSPDWFAIPECRSCHDDYENLWRGRQDGQSRFEENEARKGRAAIYLLQAIVEGHLTWRKA